MVTIFVATVVSGTADICVKSKVVSGTADICDKSKVVSGTANIVIDQRLRHIGLRPLSVTSQRSQYLSQVKICVGYSQYL